MINEQTSVKAIRTIDNDIDIPSERFKIGLVKVGIDHFNSYMRIEPAEPLTSHLHFRLSNIGISKQNLAMQIFLLHFIAIDQAQRSHACSSQVLSHGTTQTSQAHDQHMPLHEPLLSFPPDFGQQHLSAISHQIVHHLLSQSLLSTRKWWHKRHLSHPIEGIVFRSKIAIYRHAIKRIR